MNTKIGLAACLSVFTLASLSLPVFAVKTAPMVGKVKTQSVLTKKLSKKAKKISLSPKANRLISCGKK